MKILYQLKKNGIEVIPIIVSVPSSLKTVNFFLYKTEDSLTLIDAGFDNDECWNAIQNVLHDHGWSVQDINRILLTHHHIDHVGLVNRIVNDHPIPVYAHSLAIPRLKREEDFLSMRIEFFSKLYQEMGCKEQGEKQIAYLQKALQKNKDKKIEAAICKIEGNQLFDFDVIYVPGHAPDQIAFYQKECGWLFGGDLLLEHVSSNALVEPDADGIRMLTVYDHYHSLKRVLGIGAELVLPGHGKLIEDPKAAAQMRMDEVEQKADKFLKLIQAGSTTAAEVAKAYYNETYLKEFPLVMSRVIGHLDYLEVIGKVRREMIDGVWHYSAD
ncbi:MBL fold metallo-hydrolase [Neobacillus mesonae]|uniref:MBL fold metallo-hydrolase n=1 Tax=Neobacillus mesonae TaxID=1193713 RepID=UPI00203F417A|nr:MBL fold metallo-hydrolase [Neobacillus mesonae]MCM3570578.1 MBL fold metallo-hydrolase [Neobacillus mesonae]